MLKDLRKYQNLGTPDYFFELFNNIKNNKSTNWRKEDLEGLFYNKIISGRSIFDGCLELAIKIKILVQNEDFILLNSSFEIYLNSINQMKDRFNLFLFEAIKKDRDFLTIFSSRYLSHDIIYKSLQISNSAFGLKFTNFKQLLIDFNILNEHPTKLFNSFIINQRYKTLFDKTVLPEIKKRKIGIEEFKRKMEQQQIFGEEAEKFVLKFEHLRLNEKKEIDWVAEYIVNEGYDIASYNSESDKEPNRFIEVKSYDGNTPYFYWSRNEYNVAKLKKNEYWIYLVNRKKMNDSGYEPIMKQNPIESIIESVEWEKEIDKYRIKLLANA